MSESQIAPESAEVMTRESLLPSGWDKPRPKQPEPAEDVPDSELEEGETETFAESQEDTEQHNESESSPEAVIERMKLNKFLDDAGVSMDEFYRQVYVERDGKEVSVSKAWDDYSELTQANEALLRERGELQEKLNHISTQVPMQDTSPEAEVLARQAEVKLQAIRDTDWSKWEPGAAANAKLDLQMQAQDLWAKAQQKQVEHEQGRRTAVAKAIDEADRQTRSRIPQWNDAKVKEQEWNAVADMAKQYGISRQELDTAISPAWRHMLRDAMVAKAEKERVAKGVKKVRKVGTMLKSGARSTPGPKKGSLEGAKETLAKARESGMTHEELVQMRLKVPLG